MKACIFVGLLVAFVSGCTQPDQRDGSDAPVTIPKVRVQEIHKQPWTESVTTYGVIESAEEIELTSRVAAEVKAVHFAEGVAVKEGDLLLEYDSEAQQLRVEKAEVAVEEARLRLEDARKQLDRSRALFADGSIAQQELDNAELLVDTSATQYEDSLAAQSLARKDLKDTKITSPVDGMVQTRNAHPGEMVVPGSLLGRIEANETVRVVTFVGERVINFLRVDMPARVTSQGVRGRVYDGRIESIQPKADPETGNFNVRIALPNNDGMLKPGMTASVTLEGIVYEDVMLVPDTAVVSRNRKRVLYRVVDNVAEEVEPVLAVFYGDRVPVVHGLSQGDRLIVSGLEHVIDGSLIDVID